MTIDGQLLKFMQAPKKTQFPDFERTVIFEGTTGIYVGEYNLLTDRYLSLQSCNVKDSFVHEEERNACGFIPGWECYQADPCEGWWDSFAFEERKQFSDEVKL